MKDLVIPEGRGVEVGGLGTGVVHWRAKGPNGILTYCEWRNKLEVVNERKTVVSTLLAKCSMDSCRRSR
jgi:hypothetical protein